MTRDLWQHQKEALANLRASIGQGVKKIVLQSPTGSGKTTMAASIVEGAQRKGNRLAFVVSSISLVDQTVESFYAEGIRNIGVIQAEHQMTDWSQPVQVCSIDTIRSRGAWPEAPIKVFDECHVLHETHKKWMAECPNDIFIGLSATPWTKNLGKYFDSLLVVATTQELINKGILSPFKVFATGHPDLTGVKTVAGDFHEGQLSAAMQEGTLTADIIRTWRERWGQGKTLVFGVDCAHAQALQARFQEAGVTCAYQDAKTPWAERAEIKRAFHSGAVQAVCNVGTLTTGVDWDVRCLVLARPTKSEMLYVQIIGRGLRTAPGKEFCTILDHSDTTARLGFVTDIHHDTLHTGKDVEKPERKKALPKPCPQCDSMLPRMMGVCQNCGFKLEPQLSGLIEQDGELVELTADGFVKKIQKEKKTRDLSREELARFYGGLRYIALERGYRDGWAAQQYRKKFSVWPAWDLKGAPPCTPTVEVRQYVRSRQIAWARSKKVQNEKHP